MPNESVSSSKIECAPPTGGVRYAPSPTGRFHIGNLRTAWISRLLADEFHLPLIVRFEDIDRPRVKEGAMALQLEDMKTLGIVPDVTLVQSEYHERHWSLFLRAIEEGQVYACDCSRKDVQTALAGIASAPHDGSDAPFYSGRCRSLDCTRELEAKESLAWRFKAADESGQYDFIVARTSRDFQPRSTSEANAFVPAYHWACAIDDHDGAYDLLVRAWDLSSAIRSQREIHHWLASTVSSSRKPAAVFHTSLVTQDDGHRLEKRTLGVTLDELIASGWTSKRILQAFENGFDVSSAMPKPALEALAGETRKSLKVSDLLIR